ncbi:MAG: hypothetical protein JJU20_02260 [Opitutales bacterium]|nr:hypothetical protein [Opitutales bacterium]
MPVYVYETLNPIDCHRHRFELCQSINEAPLTHHPKNSDLPVRRVIQAPYVSSCHTPGSEKQLQANETLERSGFTKYERDKQTGRYHRVTGKGGPVSFDNPYK